LKQAVALAPRARTRLEALGAGPSRTVAPVVAPLVGPALMPARPPGPPPAPIPNPCALAANLPYCKPWRP